jgi:hypothetical protein
MNEDDYLDEEEEETGSGHEEGNSDVSDEEDDDVPLAAVAVEEPVDDEEEDGDDEEEAAVALVVEEDHGEDDEEEVVEAAAEEDFDEHENEVNAVAEHVMVAMEEEGEEEIPEVEAVAIVEDVPPPPLPPKKSKAPAAAKSTKSKGTKKPLKKTAASSSSSSARSPKKSAATKNVKAKTKAVAETAASKAKKQKKRKQVGGKTTEQVTHFARIDAKRMAAANAARELLYESVPRLPFPVINDQSPDQYYVRNFGRLKVGSDKIAAKFCTPTSLYPVGFSCDRYEFSPSHGRVLKIRCSIIDGKVIGETGPIFRVMWGEGVDSDVDKVEYPYDPFSNSAPITSGNANDDVVAVPASAGYHPPADQVVPAPGMRIKARFDKNQFFHGTITSVTEKDGDAVGSSAKGKKKKKKKVVKIVIQYDDGSNEETIFPDPDITLVMPGTH